ncbi:LysR family transcriptional regulator [Methylocella sp. CPCC 101449]|uniref:LysR family transcriptional regulator n=1 Tax=Methylocella sp. CPCC 101449 TaxID=2987531 RepID=UPI0028909594|nr:LysR family transcriptional regulator [Methylocella sp. CPCC 101449]MDT2024287.1 LysR family transcriptional regulator [Methylocella sp. CPCC 101449]
MDFRGLDLNLLLLLDALVQDPNQSRVAKNLKISQPTVSASLAKLRALLKDDLIVKSGAGFLPTPRLLSIAPAIKQILNVLNEEIIGQGEFDPSFETRPLIIATSDVGEMILLPNLIAKLKIVAPHMPIRSVVVKPAELEEALGEAKIDIAVGYFPDITQSTIYQQLLFEQGFVCLVGDDHSQIGDSLSLEQFLNCDHIVVTHEGRSQEIFENNLKKLGLKRHMAVQVPHFLSVPFMLASSDLIVTVPRVMGLRLVSYRLKMLDPPMPTPLIPVKQFWHRRFASNLRSIWIRETMVLLFQGNTFGT